MNAPTRLLVITESGRIVGTQFISPPATGMPSVSTALRPGLGQQVHEIEMEPTLPVRTVEQIHAFHEAVAKALGPDRLYGRK